MRFVIVLNLYLGQQRILFFLVLVRKFKLRFCSNSVFKFNQANIIIKRIIRGTAISLLKAVLVRLVQIF